MGRHTVIIDKLFEKNNILRSLLVKFIEIIEKLAPE